MGPWKPEKTETVTVDGEEYKVHLWTVKEAPKDGGAAPSPLSKDSGTRATDKDKPKKDSAPKKDG
jgi:hypothetical protein